MHKFKRHQLNFSKTSKSGRGLRFKVFIKELADSNSWILPSSGIHRTCAHSNTTFQAGNTKMVCHHGAPVVCFRSRTQCGDGVVASLHLGCHHSADAHQVFRDAARCWCQLLFVGFTSEISSAYNESHLDIQNQNVSKWICRSVMLLSCSVLLNCSQITHKCHGLRAKLFLPDKPKTRTAKTFFGQWSRLRVCCPEDIPSLFFRLPDDSSSWLVWVSFAFWKTNSRFCTIKTGRTDEHASWNMKTTRKHSFWTTTTTGPLKKRATDCCQEMMVVIKDKNHWQKRSTPVLYWAADRRDIHREIQG